MRNVEQSVKGVGRPFSGNKIGSLLEQGFTELAIQVINRRAMRTNVLAFQRGCCSSKLHPQLLYKITRKKIVYLEVYVKQYCNQLLNTWIAEMELDNFNSPTKF